MTGGQVNSEGIGDSVLLHDTQHCSALTAAVARGEQRSSEKLHSKPLVGDLGL